MKRRDGAVGWMDYLNNYYKYKVAHPTTPRADCLFNQLLYEHNRAWWPDSIMCKSEYLAGLCNMSRSSVYRAREELAELRIISYEERGANRPSVYRINNPYTWSGRIDPDEYTAFKKSLSDTKEARNHLATEYSSGRLTASDYRAAIEKLDKIDKKETS